MGNVTSRPSEVNSASVFLRDQSRFAIKSIIVTNLRNRVLLTISPNEYPATRLYPRKEAPDESPVDYIADPDLPPSSSPNFLLNLQNEDELIFQVSYIIRRAELSSDTVINGLTFMVAATHNDLHNLVTKELQADPNLHKNNPNVSLIGEKSTSGSSSMQYEWSWKWKPVRTDDRGRGWKNCCSFVEYDQRSHKLEPLATFSFWVTNLDRPRSPNLSVNAYPSIRTRLPSAHSIESRISDSDGGEVIKDGPHSPILEGIPTIPEYDIPIETSLTGSTTATSVPAAKLDTTSLRQIDDLTAVEDGPLFRASLKAMELKTGNLKVRWKKVLKRAETAHETQIAYNSAFSDLIAALRDAAHSSGQAVQPVMKQYFDNIAKEVLLNDVTTANSLQRLVISPIETLYYSDIKQADNKKRDFDEESKEYYAFVSRYLGQRQDSLKEKKRVETDTKYQNRKRDFELKKIDYSSYLQDLHGGRKVQKVLSSLTEYANSQANGYLTTAKKIESLLPQLEALNSEVRQADKLVQIHRTEREERRRAVEKGSETAPSAPPTAQGNILRSNDNFTSSVSSIARSISQSLTSGSSNHTVVNNTNILSSSPSNKFKGIRDLEERDYNQPTGLDGNGTPLRKEGLVWALSKPGSHVDPRGLNKQAWHKFWIVLDQGKLSEYTNWKQKLDLHMDPIDLRVASVREARNSDRRFCFEIMTPNFTRVYQAVSEDDMKSWIYTINNALQSAVEAGKNSGPVLDSPIGSSRKDFASVLTGKSFSPKHPVSHHNKSVGRHATVSDKPQNRNNNINNGNQDQTNDEESLKLRQALRDADPSNVICADCTSEIKVDWVSINLGVIICIECSGIHRSLGTHVSKVRSLTLDLKAFTPDVVEILLNLGNKKSNAIWEAKLSSEEAALRKKPQATRDDRFKFITVKYVDRFYVQELSAGTSQITSADDHLLDSIKQNNISKVAHALALQGNPNIVDASQGIHSIFLSLAVTEPVPSPTTIQTNLGNVPNHQQPQQSSFSRRPFAVAELLLLNGAQIPDSESPIPLSQAGNDYVAAKRDQRLGRRTTVALGPANSTYRSMLDIHSPVPVSNPIPEYDTVNTVSTTSNPSTTPNSPDVRRKRISSGGIGNKLTKAAGAPPGT